VANKARGEAALTADGKCYRLLLTLGALAEIEDGLGLAAIGEMGRRLAQPRAGDLAIVAAALLRGGGHDMTPDEVLRLGCDLGALVAAVTRAFEAIGGGEGKGGPFAGATSSPSDWAP